MIRHSESMWKRCQAFVLFIVILGIGTGLAQAQSNLERQILSRIAPVGDVCLIGQSCASGIQAAGGAGGGDTSNPEVVYETYCFACHTTGANESPVIGNAEMWAPRLEKGMDVLYQSAIEGFNEGLMPPKGLCMACSEEEVRATVDYMVEQVQ